MSFSTSNFWSWFGLIMALSGIAHLIMLGCRWRTLKIKSKLWRSALGFGVLLAGVSFLIADNSISKIAFRCGILFIIFGNATLIWT